jgi:membrane-bound lytic murein transglycosylase F
MVELQKYLRLWRYQFTLVILLLVSCTTPEADQPSTTKPSLSRDLKEVIQDRKLVALMENSTISYFIYRGQSMGLEYEILSYFAKHLGVQLEVRIVKDLDEMIPLLEQEEGDLIACNLTVTKERRKQLDFSVPHMRAPQVLVQRKPEDWRTRKKKDWQQELLQSPDELAGKTVHVWKNSSYYKRLLHLQDELGDTIYIQFLEGNIIAEDIIQRVSEGIIDYTVTDQNVAQINQRFYPNVDLSLELSIPQKIAFGLRKTSPHLTAAFNEWLGDFMETTTYRYILHKYMNMSSFSGKSQDEYSSVGGGKISPYDDIIRKVANEVNWDWRLLAAIIYQESKFVDGKESWAGAYGLLQFMPAVGPEYGVHPDSPAEVQIRGGMKKILKNWHDWDMIEDSIQRIKFTLATFNAGLGHIQDAQRLAEKLGKDHLVWDNHVENIVLKLSKPEYYRDEVCMYGYLRGIETYNYVRKVFARYSEYSTVF